MGDAKVIDFKGAASRIGHRDRGKARLRMSIDEDAALLVRIDNGPKWAVPDEQVERLLLHLLRRHREAKTRKLGIVVEQKPERKHRDICRRQRDGGLGVVGHGCRRDKGHKGKCSDMAGLYTPAICSHIGLGVTKVHDLSTNTHRAHCRHCNADIGPCDPSLPPFMGGG